MEITYTKKDCPYCICGSCTLHLGSCDEYWCDKKIIEKLDKENIQLKEENNKLKKRVCVLRPELKYIIDKTCRKYNINAKYYHEKIVEIINNLDKYKQILVEIKEIAKICRNKNIDNCYECKYFDDCEIEDETVPTRDVCKLILTKVNEVLNNRDNTELDQ